MEISGMLLNGQNSSTYMCYHSEYVGEVSWNSVLCPTTTVDLVLAAVDNVIWSLYITMGPYPPDGVCVCVCVGGLCVCVLCFASVCVRPLTT